MNSEETLATLRSRLLQWSEIVHQIGELETLLRQRAPRSEAVSMQGNMASSTLTTAAPEHLKAFERRVCEVKVNKSDINSMIMEYLITEGYPAAAQKFAMEANVRPTEDNASIRERVAIRNAIHSGNIEDAICKINDLDYQLLERDESLHFALLRLQLVELIRTCTSEPDGDVTPAIDFAAANLAPRAPSNPEFLDDLEQTMSLLIFPTDNLIPSLAAILDPSLRKSVATRVNEAILVNQGFRREARIRELVRCRAWAEAKAREAKIDLPEKLSLALTAENAQEDGVQDTDMHENGEVEGSESIS